MGNDGL
ncbi:hypothetical protein RDI58_002479 [Solanum bulbocastanum]